jgi:hypothetical protein
MNDPYNAADLGLSLEDVLEFFDNAIDYTLLEEEALNDKSVKKSSDDSSLEPLPF